MRGSEVPGIVIWQGKRHRVALRVEFMVVDPVAWAGTLRGQMAEMRDACEEAEAAEDFAQSIREIDSWLEHRTDWVSSQPGLVYRQILKPLSVTRDNWATYVASLLETAVPASDSAEPQFVLRADGNEPQLIGTREVWAAIMHPGFVQAQMVADSAEVARAA
jgi:hypothetical protein